MKKIFLLTILLMIGGVLMVKNDHKVNDGFVSVDGKRFFLNDKPYYFLGTNLWYGMNLGSKGESGDRQRLINELDFLSNIGVKNLRVMASSEGPDSEKWRIIPSLQSAPGKYNTDLLDGLDFLLFEMGKRDMKAIMCLNNFWHWSGGMAQYVSWENNTTIPYPPIEGDGDWQKYQEYASSFYSNKEAKEHYYNHIRFIVLRENTYTGKIYRDDPTIMSWQLGNEPRGINNREDFLDWIKFSAQLIKEIDSNHLVTVGSEGSTAHPSSGNNFAKDHESEYIDYTTIHIWIQNWGWFNPADEQSLSTSIDRVQTYINEHEKLAIKLNKPVVLEEFGISRDYNNYSSNSSVSLRDKYFNKVFDIISLKVKNGSPLAGSNFWAWGGFGRPRKPKSIWKKHDQFIGDPPHEFQGWYSIYNSDLSTIKIIKKFASKLNNM
ncbi:MAG: hypothetical protein QGI18_03015 [Candidatus Marinimicrobia bacterium]|nr:hypothetical protein [Candidatus Neomarinimicrobiota bacterium]